MFKKMFCWHLPSKLDKQVDSFLQEATCQQQQAEGNRKCRYKFKNKANIEICQLLGPLSIWKQMYWLAWNTILVMFRKTVCLQEVSCDEKV